MKDFDCPYCDAPFTVCHDDGHGTDESDTHQDQCRACGKHFVFSTTVSIDHEAYKADCLNGSPHDWKRTSTYPPQYARMRCKDCGEERVPTVEELAAA